MCALVHVDTQVEASEAMRTACVYVFACVLLCKYLQAHTCVGVEICLSPGQWEHIHGRVSVCVARM